MGMNIRLHRSPWLRPEGVDVNAKLSQSERAVLALLRT